MSHQIESVPTLVTDSPLGLDARSGLTFGVAATLADVLRAWQLVYIAYRRIDLIEPNIHELHTTRHAASLNAAVIIGELGDEVRTTMTAIHDSPFGLPLDSVYGAELDALRARGRRLSEVGLFADRRGGIGRSVGALLNLMRIAFYYALVDDSATIVIGVHPHHVGFYERLFDFERLGETRSYPLVNDRLVVLMQLPLRERLQSDTAAGGVVHFKAHPIAPDAYDNRFSFPPEALRTPPLSAFTGESLGDEPSPV